MCFWSCGMFCEPVNIMSTLSMSKTPRVYMSNSTFAAAIWSETHMKCKIRKVLKERQYDIRCVMRCHLHHFLKARQRVWSDWIKMESGDLGIWGECTYFCECIWPKSKTVTNYVRDSKHSENLGRPMSKPAKKLTTTKPHVSLLRSMYDVESLCLICESPYQEWTSLPKVRANA